MLLPGMVRFFRTSQKFQVGTEAPQCGKHILQARNVGPGIHSNVYRCGSDIYSRIWRILTMLDNTKELLGFWTLSIVRNSKYNKTQRFRTGSVSVLTGPLIGFCSFHGTPQSRCLLLFTLGPKQIQFPKRLCFLVFRNPDDGHCAETQ
jgi:hypothetical protein